MALAFDVFTGTYGEGTGDITGTNTHTPSGTPRAVFVHILQDGTGADSVTGVTYGGVSMTEITSSNFANVVDNSPYDATAPTDRPCRHHGFFLGSGIPTGAQNIVASGTGLNSGHVMCCLTLTAASDTTVENAAGDVQASVGPASVNLGLNGETCYVLQCGRSGGLVGSIDPDAGWGTDFQKEINWGDASNHWYSYDTIGTSDVTCSWSGGSVPASVWAVAIREAAAASTSTPWGMQALARTVGPQRSQRVGGDKQ